VKEWVIVVNSEQHSVHADVLQCQGQKSVGDRNMTELEEHYALPLQIQWQSVAIYPSILPHLLVIIQELLTRFSCNFKLEIFTKICQ